MDERASISRRTRPRAVVRLAGALVALGALGPSAAPGADPPARAPVYLRLWVAPTGERLEGRLVDDDAESLVLQNDDWDKKHDTRRIARRDISRLEVRNRESKKGKGLLLGVAAGLGVAAIVGLTSKDYTKVEGCFLCWSKADQAGLTAVLTVPVGGLIGLAVAPGGQWTRVSSPDRLIGKAPSRAADGFSARVVLSF